jgi:glutamine cyclotransferase
VTALPALHRLSVVVLLAALGLTGCRDGHLGTATVPAAPERLTVEVLARIPVSPVFTEGLDWAEGTLYESSGLVGRSSVRALDPNTGAIRVQQAVPDVFGEGVTVTGRHLWELTWKDHVVIQRDRATLTEVRRIPLSGAEEGWGACAGGGTVLTSDGTARIAVREPGTFNVQRYIDVHDNNGPVSGINELDCSQPDQRWANVFPTDRLIRIDASGHVTGEADLSGLHHQTGLDAPDDVPNGVATVPGTDTMFLTGKQWPDVLKVRIVQPKSTSDTPAKAVR